MTRGFRRCQAPLHREHVPAAREALNRHFSVDPGSVHYNGTALHFTLDLSCLPNGDGPCVEAKILEDIEKAVRP